MEDYFLYIDDLPSNKKVQCNSGKAKNVSNTRLEASVPQFCSSVGRKKLRKLLGPFWMLLEKNTQLIVKVCNPVSYD